MNDDDRFNEMVQMRREGLSYGKIAAKFGISRQRAHRIINSAPGKHDEPWITEKDAYLELIRLASTTDVSWEDVAKKLEKALGPHTGRQISAKALFWCKKFGVKVIPRKRGRPALKT